MVEDRDMRQNIAGRDRSFSEPYRVAGKLRKRTNVGYKRMPVINMTFYIPGATSLEQDNLSYASVSGYWVLSTESRSRFKSHAGWSLMKVRGKIRTSFRTQTNRDTS